MSKPSWEHHICMYILSNKSKVLRQAGWNYWRLQEQILIYKYPFLYLHKCMLFLCIFYQFHNPGVYLIVLESVCVCACTQYKLD